MLIWYMCVRALQCEGIGVGEMHARKIANIYDMAMKMGALLLDL